MSQQDRLLFSSTLLRGGHTYGRQKLQRDSDHANVCWEIVRLTVILLVVRNFLSDPLRMKEALSMESKHIFGQYGCADWLRHDRHVAYMVCSLPWLDCLTIVVVYLTAECRQNSWIWGRTTIHFADPPLKYDISILPWLLVKHKTSAVMSLVIDFDHS